MKTRDKLFLGLAFLMAVVTSLYAVGILYVGTFQSGSGTSTFNSDGSLTLGTTTPIGNGNASFSGTGTFGTGIQSAGPIVVTNAPSTLFTNPNGSMTIGGTGPTGPWLLIQGTNGTSILLSNGMMTVVSPATNTYVSGNIFANGAVFTNGVSNGTLYVTGLSTLKGGVTSPGAGFLSEQYGASSTTVGNDSLAVGGSANTTAAAGTAIGEAASAGNQAEAIGASASASAQNSIAIGNGATIASVNTAQLGASSTPMTLLLGSSGTALVGSSSTSGGSLTGINPSALTGTGTIPYAAYGAIPASLIDSTMGRTNITGCFHDCQYAPLAFNTPGFSTVSGTSVLYCGSSIVPGPFTIADIGKTAYVNVNGLQFSCTITNWTNSWTVSGNFIAGSTITNISAAWGHSDSLTLSNQTWNLTNANYDLLAPPGQYMCDLWATLPYSAGFACIVMPFTNCDYKINGINTILIEGYQVPSIRPSLNTTFPEPLPTNGTVFCFPASAPSATAAVCIGAANSPTTLTGGWDAIDMCLKNVTMRCMSNWNGNAVIGGRRMIDMELLGTVVVDDGTPTPYSTAPSTSTSYGVRFPDSQNFGDDYADRVYVQGMYNGFYINEHVKANWLFAECCRVGFQMGLGLHDNWVGSALVLGCGYAMYYINENNTTVFNNLDIEEDETLVANLNFVNLLLDASSDTYGYANLHCLIAATGVPGTPTNSPVNPLHFTMVNNHTIPFVALSFTGTQYINTNSFPVQVSVVCSSTGITVSNQIPTVQSVNNTVFASGTYSRVLPPGWTITNNSAAMFVDQSRLATTMKRHINPFPVLLLLAYPPGLSGDGVYAASTGTEAVSPACAGVYGAMDLR